MNIFKTLGQQIFFKKTYRLYFFKTLRKIFNYKMH
jgi:hypothetical protein